MKRILSLALAGLLGASATAVASAPTLNDWLRAIHDVPSRSQLLASGVSADGAELMLIARNDELPLMVRNKAAGFLGIVGGDAVVRPLTQLATDEALPNTVRAQAMRAMRFAAPATARQVLPKLLQSANAQVRKTAAIRLSDLGETKLVDAFLAAEADLMVKKIVQKHMASLAPQP